MGNALPIPYKPLQPISRWVWAMFAAALCTLALGTYGFWVAEGLPLTCSALSEALYQALQLFLLRMPSLSGGSNGYLETARWMAVILSDFVVLTTLYQILVGDWHRLSLKWARGHVVVCGLGEVGRQLAIEFRQDRHRVVAIERDPSVQGIDVVKAHGVTILFGNASDKRLLSRARAHRAKTVLAVCSEDDTNIAIAATVQEQAKLRHSAPPDAKCLLLLTDRILRDKIMPLFHNKEQKGEFRIKVGGLDVPDMVARRVFQDYPLDFDGIGRHSPFRTHLVVVGSCPLAKAIVVKALQLCHIANHARLLVSVLAPDAAVFISHVRRLHPHCEAWYDAQAIAPDTQQPLPEQLAGLSGANQFFTVVLCEPHDGHIDKDTEIHDALQAIDVASALRESDPVAKGHVRSQVLTCLRHQPGFESLFSSLSGSKPDVPVHAFGLLETFCHRDALLHESHDAIARSMHEEYRAEQAAKKQKAKENNEPYETRSADMPWEDLPESFRDSNRLSADHLAIKLRAVGLRLGAKGQAHAVNEFLDPDNNLARVEHERWCAEHWLDGWQHGAVKSEAAKIHPDLVAWDRLAQGERNIDIHFVEKTVRILARVKMAIYPADSVAEGEADA